MREIVKLPAERNVRGNRLDERPALDAWELGPKRGKAIQRPTRVELSLHFGLSALHANLGLGLKRRAQSRQCVGGGQKFLVRGWDQPSVRVEGNDLRAIQPAHDHRKARALQSRLSLKFLQGLSRTQSDPPGNPNRLHGSIMRVQSGPHSITRNEKYKK